MVTYHKGQALMERSVDSLGLAIMHPGRESAEYATPGQAGTHHSIVALYGMRVHPRAAHAMQIIPDYVPGKQRMDCARAAVCV